MQVIASPGSVSQSQIHPDRPSDEAIERLIDGIRKALVIQRQQVQIADLTLRFLRRNEIFVHEGTEYQALEPGIFKLATWIRSGANGQPEETGTRWLHYVSSDDLEAVVTPRLMAMSKMEAEGIVVGLVANKVLAGMHARRRSMTP